MNQDENDDDGSMSHQQHLNAARTETPAKEDALQDYPPEAPFGNAAGGAEDDEVGGKQKRLEMSVLSATSEEQDMMLNILLQKKLCMDADEMLERLQREKQYRLDQNSSIGDDVGQSADVGFHERAERLNRAPDIGVQEQQRERAPGIFSPRNVLLPTIKPTAKELPFQGLSRKSMYLNHFDNRPHGKLYSTVLFPASSFVNGFEIELDSHDMKTLFAEWSDDVTSPLLSSLEYKAFYDDMRRTEPRATDGFIMYVYLLHITPSPLGNETHEKSKVPSLVRDAMPADCDTLLGPDHNGLIAIYNHYSVDGILGVQNNGHSNPLRTLSSFLRGVFCLLDRDTGMPDIVKLGSILMIVDRALSTPERVMTDEEFTQVTSQGVVDYVLGLEESTYVQYLYNTVDNCVAGKISLSLRANTLTKRKLKTLREFASSGDPYYILARYRLRAISARMWAMGFVIAKQTEMEFVDNFGKALSTPAINFQDFGSWSGVFSALVLRSDYLCACQGFGGDHGGLSIVIAAKAFMWAARNRTNKSGGGLDPQSNMFKAVMGVYLGSGVKVDCIIANEIEEALALCDTCAVGSFDAMSDSLGPGLSHDFNELSTVSDSGTKLSAPSGGASNNDSVGQGGFFNGTVTEPDCDELPFGFVNRPPIGGTTRNGCHTCQRLECRSNICNPRDTNSGKRIIEPVGGKSGNPPVWGKCCVLCNSPGHEGNDCPYNRKQQIENSKLFVKWVQSLSAVHTAPKWKKKKSKSPAAAAALTPPPPPSPAVPPNDPPQASPSAVTEIHHHYHGVDGSDSTVTDGADSSSGSVYIGGVKHLPHP